jgi:hypothetical protein
VRARSLRIATRLLAAGSVVGLVLGAMLLIAGKTFHGAMWVLLAVSWAASARENWHGPKGPRTGRPSRLGIAMLVTGIAVIVVVVLMSIFSSHP